MKVPFLDLKVQYHVIKDEFYRKLDSVCENTAFIMSPYVERFEESFARFCGIDYCVGVNSGTDALTIALESLGIGRGDEVIIPVNTFFATAESVCHVGATPVFVDIKDDSKSIDPEKISSKITPRTKAVFPVHLFGNPAPMDEIKCIVKDKRIEIVEDACQAHGALYKRQKIGTFGKVAAYSFYPGKNLGAFGDAGALVTNDENLYRKIKILRNHGSFQKYDHKYIGYNSRLDAVQAIVLDCKLKYLDGWNKKRQGKARIYNTLLKDIPWIRIPEITPDAESVYHLYTVEITDPRFKRDELLDYLKENSIGCGIHYPVPLHLTKGLSFLGYNKGDFPVAEKTMANHLSLPVYAELEAEMIEYVVAVIKAFGAKK